MTVAEATSVSNRWRWHPVRDSNSCYRRERAVSWASRRTGLRHGGGLAEEGNGVKQRVDRPGPP